jgi:hypothetical protein
MESQKAAQAQQEAEQKLVEISQRVEVGLNEAGADLEALLAEVRQMTLSDERVNLESRIGHALRARGLKAWITAHEENLDDLTAALITEKKGQIEALPAEFQGTLLPLLTSLETRLHDLEMKGQVEKAREFIIKTIQLIASTHDPDSLDKAELTRIKQSLGEWPEVSRQPLEAKIAELETELKLAESVRGLNHWVNAPVPRSLEELKSKQDEINLLPSVTMRASLLAALGKLQSAAQMRLDQGKSAQIELALLKLDEQQRAGTLKANAAAEQLRMLSDDLNANMTDVSLRSALNARLQAESQRYQQILVAEIVSQDIEKLGSRPSSKEVSALRYRIDQITDKKLADALMKKLPVVAATPITPAAKARPAEDSKPSGKKEPTYQPAISSWSGTYKDGNRSVTVSGGSVTVIMRMSNGTKVTSHGRLSSSGSKTASYSATNPLGETISGSISR